MAVCYIRPSWGRQGYMIIRIILHIRASLGGALSSSSQGWNTLRLSKALCLSFALILFPLSPEITATARSMETSTLSKALTLEEQGAHFPEPPADFPSCPLVRIVSHVLASTSHSQGQWNYCDWLWAVKTHPSLGAEREFSPLQAVGRMSKVKVVLERRTG